MTLLDAITPSSLENQSESNKRRLHRGLLQGILRAVIRLSFAKDLNTAVKGADTVMIVAPRRVLAQKKVPSILPAKMQRLLLALAKDVKPGLNGQIACTLTQGQPARLSVAMLPDEVSRYNCPARPEPIQKLLQTSGLAKQKRVAVVLVLEDPSHLTPAVNAVGRAFPLFNRKTERPANARIQIVALDQNGQLLKSDSRQKELLKTTREIAQLVDSPPTEMSPEGLAEAARALLSDLDVEITEHTGDALLELGCRGIHAVGRAAASAPRLLIATHRPKKSESDLHVALVGKGVTFDTGGLHIKARGSMETMKCDMGGSAAVLGAFRVLAKTGSPHPVSLVMCLAENAIGPISYKPDDIIEMHSGRTVEINNTDAEGRLLLADGVSWAARVLEAQVVLDAATLTGAQLIATGQMHAAVMSNDEALERTIVAAGFASGDLVHPLPFAPEFYKTEFKSQVADMKNSVKNRANAQSSCAAQFVYNHIENTGVRWGHIDLAGPAFRNERGTGYGVALLAETVRRL